MCTAKVVLRTSRRRIDSPQAYLSPSNEYPCCISLADVISTMPLLACRDVYSPSMIPAPEGRHPLAEHYELRTVTKTNLADNIPCFSQRASSSSNQGSDVGRRGKKRAETYEFGPVPFSPFSTL